MSSFALILVGLFIAGPWLTMTAARAMARWTSRPGTLLAARRIADDPGRVPRGQRPRDRPVRHHRRRRGDHHHATQNVTGSAPWRKQTC